MSEWSVQSLHLLFIAWNEEKQQLHDDADENNDSHKCNTIFPLLPIDMRLAV